MRFALTALLLAPGLAFGSVDPKCADYVIPDNYNEQAQQDYLLNYFALATTYSAIHGPIPHNPGHGAIGVDLAVMPPLGCAKRIVLSGTKTEDTNKTPVVPRLRMTFAFPSIGKFVPYGGLAYVPPVKLFGTTNVIVSGEAGFGVPLGEIVQVGGRFNYTLQKTVGEIATPFVDGDAPFDDLYLGSTFGADASVGFDLGTIVPYLAGGFTDVSTFFYISDDGVVSNNLHPYFGPVFSAGVDGLVKERFRFGAEFFGASGGYSLPNKEIESVKPAARYGSLYTARFRLAVEL